MSIGILDHSCQYLVPDNDYSSCLRRIHGLNYIILYLGLPAKTPHVLQKRFMSCFAILTVTLVRSKLSCLISTTRIMRGPTAGSYRSRLAGVNRLSILTQYQSRSMTHLAYNMLICLDPSSLRASNSTSIVGQNTTPANSVFIN